MNVEGKPARLADIDKAKGLAILLVVFGHIVMREQPLGNEWYKMLRTAVYTFHMPFFMFLSGLVFFYTGSAVKTGADYKAAVLKRAYRLLLPFFFMGVVITFGKSFAKIFMHVDNSNFDVLEGLKALVWDTQHSPATSLWYIYVVFIYAAVTPLLLRLFQGNIYAVLALAAGLYIMPPPPVMYLDKVFHFFAFFVLGGLAVQNYQRYLEFIDRYKAALLLLFIASFGLLALNWHWLFYLAFIGVLSIPALHAVLRCAPTDKPSLLEFLGRYSFVIYLFHTITIGLTKGIMLHFLSWDGVNFLIFFPVLMLAAIGVPLFLKFFIFRRIKFLDTLTA